MKVTIMEPFKALPRDGAKAKVCFGGKTMELFIWKKQWDDRQKAYGEKFRIGHKLNEMTFRGIRKEYRGGMQLAEDLEDCLCIDEMEAVILLENLSEAEAV